jgi:signal transduction histidine kinase
MRLTLTDWKRYVLLLNLFFLQLSVPVFGKGQQLDTVYVRTLIDQVPALMRSDEAEARKKMAVIASLSSQLKYKHGQVESAFFRSWLKYRHSPVDTCIASIDSALRHIVNLSKDPAEIKFYILKGQCYVKKTRFDLAVSNFNVALKIAEAKKDVINKNGVLLSIGWAYMEDGKPKEAITFFDEILTLNPQLDYPSRATVMCNIASCYNMLGNYQRAEEKAVLGIEAAKRTSSMTDLANGLNILARSYYQRGKFTQAINYLKEASKAREKVEDPAMLASDYLELADVYLKIKQPQQAVLYAKRAESIASSHKIELKLQGAYETLANSYQNSGDYKNATLYFNKLISLKDSVSSGNYSKALAELQVKYDSEKKASENLKLKKENLENKLDISNKQKWLVVLISGLLLVVASGIYSYYLIQNRYRARRAEEQVLEQKQRAVAILETEENERRRIAGDLHDGVCQTLAAISLQLKKAVKNGADFEKVDYLIDQAGDEVRAISHQMTPELLRQVGLVKAIKYGVDQLNDADSGVHFSFYNHVEFENINDVMGVVVYRSFQELINNVLKHAKARNVSIQLIINEEEVLLMVEDDGQGFDKNNGKLGLGLNNLESRIKIFDGHLTLDSTLNRGTTAILRFSSIRFITESKYTDA